MRRVDYQGASSRFGQAARSLVEGLVDCENICRIIDVQADSLPGGEGNRIGATQAGEVGQTGAGDLERAAIENEIGRCVTEVACHSHAQGATREGCPTAVTIACVG